MPDETKNEIHEQIKKMLLDQAASLSKDLGDAYKNKSQNDDNPGNKLRYALWGMGINFIIFLSIWAVDKGWDATAEKANLIETMKITQDNHVKTLEIIGTALKDIRDNQIKNQERIESLLINTNKNSDQIEDLRIKVYELQKASGLVSAPRGSSP